MARLRAGATPSKKAAEHAFGSKGGWNAARRAECSRPTLKKAESVESNARGVASSGGGSSGAGRKPLDKKAEPHGGDGDGKASLVKICGGAGYEARQSRGAKRSDAS